MATWEVLSLSHGRIFNFVEKIEIRWWSIGLSLRIVNQAYEATLDSRSPYARYY